MNYRQRPIGKTAELISEEVSGERVIYDASQKKAHHLNSTLTWIWNRCDGKSTIDELALAFEQEFGVPNGLHVVMTGLRQLDERGLLEESDAIHEAVSGVSVDNLVAAQAVSRRSLVAGGAVLMPLIVSILAPTSAAAKSREPGSKRDEVRDRVRDRVDEIRERLEDLIARLRNGR